MTAGAEAQVRLTTQRLRDLGASIAPVVLIPCHSGRVAAGTPKKRHWQRRWPVATVFLVALFALAGYGPAAGPAPAAVVKALSRTEAARTARFELIISGSGPLSKEVGVVNFAKSELSFELIDDQAGATSPVQQSWLVGTKEYDHYTDASAGSSWGSATTEYRLGALAFPLMAVDPHDKVVSMGERNLGGSATTEYRLEAPATTEGWGIRVGAHAVYLWLDSHGRIRQVSYTEPQTVPGRSRRGPCVHQGDLQGGAQLFPLRCARGPKGAEDGGRRLKQSRNGNIYLYRVVNHQLALAASTSLASGAPAMSSQRTC